MDLITGLGATAVEGVKAKYERKDRKNVMKKEDIVRDKQESRDEELHKIAVEQEKLNVKMKKLEIQEKLQNIRSTSTHENASVPNAKEESTNKQIDVEAKLIEAITDSNIAMVAQMCKHAAGLDLDCIIAAHDIALSMGNTAISRLTMLALDKKKKCIVSNVTGGFKQATSVKKNVLPKFEAVQNQINPKKLTQNTLKKDVQQQKNQEELSRELVDAVRSKNVVAAEKLVRRGCDSNGLINWVGGDGVTFEDPVLYYAVLVQDVALTKVLLAAPGIQVDKLGAKGLTPLLAAVHANNSGLVSLLLQHKASPHLASGDPSAPPLLNASFYGYMKICQELLEAGADPNAVDADGRHSIYLAAYKGHLGVVQLLIRSGGDPRPPVDGWTAAAVSRDNRHLATADWLDNYCN